MSVLADYIKKQLGKGFSLKEIKSKLLDVGHDIGVVEAEIGKIEKEAAAFEIKEERKLLKIILKAKDNFIGSLYNLNKNFSVLFRKIFFGKNKLIFYYLSAAVVIILVLMAVSQIFPKFKKDVCINEINKNNCYARQAMEENDTIYCEKITDASVKTACMQELWQTNECLYMQRTGFSQNEIDECQTGAFVKSLG